MLHKAIHCPYTKDANAQCTLSTTATNELGPTTRFFGGSYSESACVDADAQAMFGHMLKWDRAVTNKVVTDKGYWLRKILAQFNAEHVKPTEMMKGKAGGMTQEQARVSRRIAQVRSVTERMVLVFKFFDIFNGTPVHMSEWVYLNDYKDFVSWLILLRPPLPDHLVPDGSADVEVAEEFCGAIDGEAKSPSL